MEMPTRSANLQVSHKSSDMVLSNPTVCPSLLILLGAHMSPLQ